MNTLIRDSINTLAEWKRMGVKKISLLDYLKRMDLDGEILEIK